MSEAGTKPFTKAEMDAMRRAARDEEGIRRDFWAKLKRVGRQIPFAEDIVIAYFVLPLDAVADFLPVLGFADDAALLAAAISQVAGSITEDHRKRAREALRDAER